MAVVSKRTVLENFKTRDRDNNARKKIRPFGSPNAALPGIFTGECPVAGPFMIYKKYMAFTRRFLSPPHAVYEKWVWR